MCRKVVLLLACIFLTAIAHAQLKKRIVCLGSSTTWGTGAVPIDSSWANLTKAYFSHLGELDTLINLGGYGSTTYTAMPDDFVPPPNRPLTITGHNVTAALGFNPDIVIINFPSNDLASGYPIAETMFNLHKMYQTIIDAGKICYITTTQPRTSLATSLQPLSKIERDSIVNAFGQYSLNFYNSIVAADSLNINPIYDYDDTHVNNGGHQQLFQVVRNANIIPIAPLALKLRDFTASLQQQKVLIQWKPEEDQETFVIQRSFNNISFEDLRRLGPLPNTTSSKQSYTDDYPLAGTSFYRMKIITAGDSAFYSNTVSVVNNFGSWKIGRFYSSPGGSYNLEVLSSKSIKLGLRVIDLSGRMIYATQVSITPPSKMIPVSLPGLVKGQYFIQMTSPQGEKDVRAFQKP